MIVNLHLNAPTGQLILFVLGRPLRLIPKSNCIRVFIACSFYYGILISTTLQAGLYQVLTTNVQEKQITSRNELIESGVLKISKYSVHYVDNIADIVVKSEGRALYALLEFYEYEDDIAVMSTESAALYNVDKYKKVKTGKPKYQLIDKALMKFHTCVHFQKGHPIFDVFEYWLLQIHAAGFSNKVHKELKSSYNKAVMKLVDVALPLQLSDFELPFYILLCGNAAGIICALMEYLYCKLLSVQ